MYSLLDYIDWFQCESESHTGSSCQTVVKKGELLVLIVQLRLEIRIVDREASVEVCRLLIGCELPRLKLQHNLVYLVHWSVA